MVTPLFELDQVSKSYIDGSTHVQVLSSLSLTISSGESLVVTGPSGSGKSTLLNILAGLIDIDGGAVYVHQKHRQSAEKLPWHQMKLSARAQWRRRHLGYVHQFFNLIPTLTVAENVMLVLQLNPGIYRSRNAQQERVNQLLDTCGMAHRAHAFPEQLSGGEQQRTAVARALVHKPLLVLADEPTGNLDKDNATGVADLLFAAAAQENAALVVATHSEVVAGRADREFSFADAMLAGELPNPAEESV